MTDGKQRGLDKRKRDNTPSAEVPPSPGTQASGPSTRHSSSEPFSLSTAGKKQKPTLRIPTARGRNSELGPARTSPSLPVGPCRSSGPTGTGAGTGTLAATPTHSVPHLDAAPPLGTSEPALSLASSSGPSPFPACLRLAGPPPIHPAQRAQPPATPFPVSVGPTEQGGHSHF